ncbi:MAG: hypothetical protein ABIU06_10005 [Anaerolineales bacterium]
MRNKKSSYRSVLMFVLMLALVAFPASVSAGHSWGSYHWARTSNPFTLKLGDNVTSTWDSYLATTSADWSQSTVLDTTIVSGSTTGRKCRATAGRVEVCNASYGNNGWLGLASIWASGSHITQGTAKMNDSYFNSAPYNTPAYRNLVMCQEVGHTFGLDHQDEIQTNTNLGTCMDYTNNPSGPPSNEHPNQHDYDQLATIYAHLDSTTTVGSAPAGFANADVHAQENWGTKVRDSADGRSALFVRDFGNGFKIFTFVTWAK